MRTNEVLEDFSIVKSGERRVKSGTGTGSSRRHGCRGTVRDTAGMIELRVFQF